MMYNKFIERIKGNTQKNIKLIKNVPNHIIHLSDIEMVKSFYTKIMGKSAFIGSGTLKPPPV